MNFPFNLNIFSTSSRCHVATPQERYLLERIRYEVMPTSKAGSAAFKSLPPKCRVSVSCSPKRGVDFGKRTWQELVSNGHDVMPHIAARNVSSPAHTKELAEWISKNDIKEVFIIGGDVDSPKYYSHALPFMKDFLECRPGVHTIGFAVYPEGHPNISSEELFQTALNKQKLLAESGVNSFATTQICYNPSSTITWIEKAREAGFHTPIRLGMPGVVDKVKLAAQCQRLGITESLRYLRRNTASVLTMLTPGGYDPTSLLKNIAPRATELNITGIHCFTFNSTKNTVKWVNEMLKKE